MRKIIPFMIITLIVIVIETSTITPIMAHDITESTKNSKGICLPFFVLSSTTLGKHPDHNFNSKICNLSFTIDDRDRRFVLDDFILFKESAS